MNIINFYLDYLDLISRESNSRKLALKVIGLGNALIIIEFLIAAIIIMAVPKKIQNITLVVEIIFYLVFIFASYFYVYKRSCLKKM